MRFLSDLPRFGVFLLGFILATVAIAAAPVSAFAQAVAAAATTVDAGSLFGQATPTIEGVAGVIAGAVVALLAYGLHRLIGVTLDEKYRTILQGALENAAHGMIVAAQGKLDGKTIDLKSTHAVDAINYVRQYVPAALKRFGLGDGDIVTLLEKQVAKLLPKDTATASAAV